MRAIFVVAAFVAGLAVPTLAWADDWVADKLRGHVLTLNGSTWTPLNRGDVVSDTRVVRTLADGRVEFTRDQETINVLGNTQLQIHDRTGQRFTTVDESFGTVSVEANVENVRHFAVATPYLISVVKGTIFTVVTGDAGSTVNVSRGHVEVTDSKSHHHTLLSFAQSASASTSGQLSVSGSGQLPAIVDPDGKAVAVTPSDSGTAESEADTTTTSKTDNGKGNGGTPGNGKDNSGKSSSDSGTGSSGDGNASNSGSDDSGNDNSGSDSSSSGKSDNGKGNGGTPGNGKGKD